MNVQTERKPAVYRDVISTLEVIDIETRDIQVLHTFDHCIEAPNWTKDARFIIYNARGLLHAYDLIRHEIQVINTGFATRCNNDHVLSPDGMTIAISHATAEDGLSRIYTVPVSGGNPTLITPIAPSYLHGWSPDGRTLVYCAERNGSYDIYSIPAMGGEETRLTITEGLSDGPEYTPSGQHIWYNASHSGLMQLYRMRKDGSRQVQMTDDDRNNWFPHVSPDGSLVAYLSYSADEVGPTEHPANKHVELRLMSARGGPATTLVSLFGGQGTINVNAWAPDGRKLAYVRYQL